MQTVAQMPPDVLRIILLDVDIDTVNTVLHLLRLDFDDAWWELYFYHWVPSSCHGLFFEYTINKKYMKKEGMRMIQRVQKDPQFLLDEVSIRQTKHRGPYGSMFIVVFTREGRERQFLLRINHSGAMVISILGFYNNVLVSSEKRSLILRFLFRRDIPLSKVTQDPSIAYILMLYDDKATQAVYDMWRMAWYE